MGSKVRLHETMGLQAKEQTVGMTPGSPFRAQPLLSLERRLNNFTKTPLRELLEKTVVASRQFNRDHPTWSDRGDLAHVFVLEKGFAFKFEILPGGQRHIADFYGPGSICNWSRLNAFEEQDDLVFKARSSVTLLDAHRLNDLFEQQPGIGSAIKRHELARVMRTTQRVRSLISRNAADKMLVTLLDIFDEFAIVGIESDWLDLPFTQQELADLLGVTPVHVSRVLAKLEEDGVIERARRRILLRDKASIKRELAYRHFFGPGKRSV